MTCAELTGPGLAVAVTTWSFIVAFDVFLALMLLRIGAWVWKRTQAAQTGMTNLGMNELFCSNCRTVSLQGSDECHECGKIMEHFDPCKHGRRLVSPANTWSQIQGKWDDHPIFEEVSQRLYELGVCGAAAHVNEFIRTLLDMVESSPLCRRPPGPEQCATERQSGPAPFRNFDGMCWPVPGERLDEVEWGLRYKDRDSPLPMEERLFAASVLVAYCSLVSASSHTRDGIVCELRKGPGNPYGDKEAKQ